MSDSPKGAAGKEGSAFKVQAVRADFPCLRQEVHGHPLVYLDNASTAQKPKTVLGAMDHFYRRDCANVHRGVHELSMRASEAYEGARGKVQRFLHAASTREIVFVRGTTEAINLVAQSWGRPRLREGDEILVSEMEHHANIVPWQLVCRQTGARLRVIPMNDDGELILEEYEKLLNERTRAVCVTHVSNVLGTVNPLKRILDAAHAAGAVTVVDGAQGAPHFPLDLPALGADFYAISGHKMYAPTGIGVLYGREELLDEMPPYQGGGDMIRTVTFEETTYNDLPFKFEAGTPHIAGGIGLGAAVDWLAKVDLAAAAAHEEQVLDRAVRLVTAIPGVRRIGAPRKRAGAFSFVLDGIHPHDAGTVLDQEGIAVRTGHHCAQPTMAHFGVPATIRASFCIYNTLEEAEALAAGVRKVFEVFAK